MRKRAIFVCVLLTVAISGTAAIAQEVTFTGTVLSYGSGVSTRTTTRSFTLNIKGVTSDTDTARFLNALQSGGQDDLLSAARRQDLGHFSVGGRLGDTLIAVRVSDGEGKRVIRAIFERRMNIAEIRGGYRSTDYPFGYVELTVDPRTGNGEGTFIAAARIRFRKDNKTGQDTIEIEDFGTFPSRLMGVRMRGTKVP